MKHKWLLLSSLIMLSTYSCVGQYARRSKKADATAQDFCLPDSIKQTLVALQHKADAVITFQYYYDNGTPESATVFWQESGRTYSKHLQNCKTSVPVTYLRADTLFSFYRQQHIADLPEMPMPTNASSHGMAYFIGVYLPGKNRFYKIREIQRHLIIYPNLAELLPGETQPEAKEDPRSIWVDLFEKVAKR